MAHPFSEEEYKQGIAALKNNKASDRDDVLVDQLKHLGQKASKWLYTMLNVWFTGTRSLRYGDNPRLSPYSSQRLRDSEEIQTNLPLMPYVQTLGTNDSKQNRPTR